MAFKLAFSTLGCPNWTIEQVGEAGRRYGYDGVELRLLDGELLPPEVDAAGRARIKKALNGLAVCCVDTSARFAFRDPDERARNRRMAEQYLALASELEAPMIRVFGGNLAEGQPLAEAVGLIADSLNELAPKAEQRGVKIVLETHDAMSAGRAVADVLSRVPSQWIGALWDSHHPFRMGEAVEETWGLIGARTLHTHVKDARRRGDGWQLVPLGDGDVPVKEMLATLKRHGWSGWVGVEWEKKWHPELADADEAMPQHAQVLRRYIEELG
ncbi:MAG TPA: sugar phosphate isomerase/epimerase family protein [Chloroflexota bacterium]|nr:sugar phosphate isomerase/epimerase family protein [Chloroflexota bacterium]